MYRIAKTTRGTQSVLSLLVAALALIAASCAGEGTVSFNEQDGDDTTTLEDVLGEDVSGQLPGTTSDDLTTEEWELIALERDAITLGLSLGKQSLADELNAVLVTKGISSMYQSTVMGAGDTYVPPAPTSECPFLDAPPEDPAAVDCRMMADQALRGTVQSMPNLLEQNPLGEEFQNNRKDNELWYQNGMQTGINNETIVALRAIRSLSVCDTAQQPSESAYEAGVEAGRAMYIDKLNERLQEVGLEAGYPNNPPEIRVCQVDGSLLQPALSRAQDEVTSNGNTIKEELCAGWEPGDWSDRERLASAQDRYLDGFAEGMENEHSLASEKIFRIIPCNVGDPLVLDLAGDGVSIVPVSESEVDFDLYATGHQLRTAWISGDDALLVLDKNGNGSVDNGRELFANFIGDSSYVEVPTGFDHLALYDGARHGGNQDGVLNAQDEIFSSLRLWQDRNGDGVSQAHELSSLEQAGVQGIFLGYTRNPRGDRQLSHHGYFQRNARGVMLTGEAMGDVYDAWFRYAEHAPVR